MKKTTVLLVLSLFSIVFFLSGCATAQGFGQDLQKVGGKIEDKARQKQ